MEKRGGKMRGNEGRTTVKMERMEGRKEGRKEEREKERKKEKKKDG